METTSSLTTKALELIALLRQAKALPVESGEEYPNEELRAIQRKVRRICMDLNYFTAEVDDTEAVKVVKFLNFEGEPLKIVFI